MSRSRLQSLVPFVEWTIEFERTGNPRPARKILRYSSTLLVDVAICFA